ncbi:MAG: GNAT family N-acetyltransferase [Bacteroidia bacterium]
MARIPKKYTFVQVNHAKLSDVEELYRLSYGVSPSLESLDNKYNTNALGLDFVGIVAYSEQYEPAAYYGVFPMQFLLGEKPVLAAQSGDTMTSPFHRMKGLFVESAHRTYAIAARSGIHFVFGFPNENSYPGFKSKLNWEFTGNMQNFKLKLRVLPLAAVSKRFGKWVNRICFPLLLRRLRKYSLSIDDLDPKAIQTNRNSAVFRDKHFLEYKKKNGAEFVKVDDFEMFVKIDGALLIGDVIPFTAERFGQFLKAVATVARQAFCHRVIFSLSQQHWLYSYFVENGHCPLESLPIGFVPFLGFKADWSEITFGRLDYDTF